jgi:serine/threonine protein kinase
VIPVYGGPRGMELDDYVRAFETACRGGEEVDLRAFLPAVDHQLYFQVLCEMVRVDLEQKWASGAPRPLADYRVAFPELFGDRECLRAITFEDYRVRCQAGEPVTPAEYERHFGVETADWPKFFVGSPANEPAVSVGPGVSWNDPNAPLGSSLLAGATSFCLESRAVRADRGGDSDSPSRKSVGGASRQTGVFDDQLNSEPAIAESLTRAMTVMPRAGDEFLGFYLLAELGSGRFSRVFLCCQSELASRLVVLKIGPRILGESRTLARLQHSSIVPIHSVHDTDVLQAACMPFMGTTTLADVINDLRTLPALPESGKYLMDRINAGRISEAITHGRPSARGDATDATGPYAVLATMAYVDAVIWIGTRLADGLAHAHGRGIVHQDLKPANILLTDQGAPMLLDFNLAEDHKLEDSVSATAIGGTLPYMAPEQLQAFQEGVRRGDERSDIYSLGIILYELLTGHYPFEHVGGKLSELPEGMVEGCRCPAPLRRWNRTVSPKAEAIIQRCLEPDRSKRYQSAREVSEDLQCHLRHIPLEYSSETTLTERVKKWVSYHPGVSAAVALVVTALVGALLLRFRHSDFLQ